jgi:hypothetical protein
MVPKDLQALIFGTCGSHALPERRDFVTMIKDLGVGRYTREPGVEHM